MISVAALALCLAPLAQLRPAPPTAPVLWFQPDGTMFASGVRFLPGTAVLDSPHGIALDVSGPRSGIYVADAPQYRLTKSITVSAWVLLRSYVKPTNSAPAGQIVF